MLLKATYIVFLALIIALFFGLGIEAFYPTPSAPEAPAQSQQFDTQGKPTTAPTTQQLEYEKKMRYYEEHTLRSYNRNVSIISLILAVFIMGISLIFALKFVIISDGMLLGGVFTLIYSIMRGLSAQNAQFSFVIVSIGLFITVFLGYWKFLRPNQHATAITR
jgi:hypothetical protein